MKNRLPFYFILYFSVAFLILQGSTVVFLYLDQKKAFEAQIPNEIWMFQDALQADLVEEDLKYTPRLTELIGNLTPENFNTALKAALPKSGFDRLMLMTANNTILADTRSEAIDTTFPYVFNYEDNKIQRANLPFHEGLYHFSFTPFTINGNRYWLVAGLDIKKEVQTLVQHLAFKPADIHYLFQFRNRPWHWITQPDIDNKAHNQLKDLVRKGDFLTAFKHDDYNYYAVNISSMDKTAQLAMIMSFSPQSVLSAMATSFIIIGVMTFLILLMLALLILYFMRKAKTLFKLFEEKAIHIEDGTVTPIEASQTPVYFNGITRLINTMIVQIQKREATVNFQSSHDPVTELPNIHSSKIAIEKLIQEDKNTSESFALIEVGIDNFHHIIHTLGRPVSDRLLKHIGTRLSKEFSADYCARLPGDAFLLLFKDLNETNYKKTAEKILKSFESPFSVFTVSIDVDAFLGFSFYPRDEKEADGLLQKADVALYAAKQAPSRIAAYDPNKDPRQFNKLSLMSELREGLTQNEFEVYYQPKVDIATGHVVQVEALARWNHPTKGFMSPGLFIPLAEETGHIKKLTLWLLDQSFKQCQEWHEKQIKIGISINLSVKDLLNPELIPYLEKLLEESPIEPHWYTMEITESAFMADPEHAMEAIRVLAKKGLKFAIDDFGTGFSSLSYLKKIPVHELKIDQSFTRDIAQNDKVGRLVDSTIHLGHSLDMIVVAEGIEDQNVFDILKSYGCDIGQGYLFSKPLSASDFTKWVRSASWGLPLL